MDHVGRPFDNCPPAPAPFAPERGRGYSNRGPSGPYDHRHPMRGGVAIGMGGPPRRQQGPPQRWQDRGRQYEGQQQQQQDGRQFGGHRHDHEHHSGGHHDHMHQDNLPPQNDMGGHPNDSVPKNAMGHCSLHNKQRCLDCLEYSASTGQYVCMADHQCKSSTPNLTHVVCMLHNKRRTPGVLIDDGNGFLRCASEHRCKGGGSAGPDGEEDVGPQHQQHHFQHHHQHHQHHTRHSQAICSLHNKMRTQQCLVSDGMGGHRCMPGEECRVRPPPEQPPPGFGPCSIHGSMREWEFLLHDGMGGFMCAEENVCPVAEMKNRKPYREHRPQNNNNQNNFNFNTTDHGATGLCSAHRKTRSVVCLQEDGHGGYQCKQDMECKVTSDRFLERQPRPNHQGPPHHQQQSQNQNQGHHHPYQRNNDDPNYRSDFQQCFIHHKPRKMACLIEDEGGNWVCAPDMRCKGIRVDYNGENIRQ
eukprot:GEMP01037307.1.p1 GENE.GEMP01037307.1~~GEMP01037307.1.p1  ORF type:complete len:472 (+),score=82.42 GEMP01037307.1:50-1465(+)